MHIFLTGYKSKDKKKFIHKWKLEKKEKIVVLIHQMTI